MVYDQSVNKVDVVKAGGQWLVIDCICIDCIEYTELIKLGCFLENCQ